MMKNKSNKRCVQACFVKMAMLAMLLAMNSYGVSAWNKTKNVEHKYPSHLHQIQGILIEEHEADWYFEQYVGWLDYALEKQKDEKAWLNCFLAKNYEMMFSHEYIDMDSVYSELLNLMEMYIPDTYVYYTCAYKGLHSGQQEGYEYGRKAFEMMPKKKSLFDYDKSVCFLKLYGEKEYSAFAKDYYESGLYSKELIQVNLNELNCMEKGGIFVGDGDATIIPKWLIQDGMGKHRDKLLICYSFMYNPDYCKRIYDELGIGDVPKMPEISNYEEYERYIQHLIDEIAVRTGRKLYMSKYNIDDCYLTWKERGALYDLGLVCQVSTDVDIDIYKEQERIFNTTDFSYLDMPLKKNAWLADIRMSSSMSSNFYQLMLYYKHRNNEAGYQKLLNMSEKAIKRIYDDTWRERAQETLDIIKNDEFEE